MINFELGVDPVFPPAQIMLALGNELVPPDASSADYYELAYGLTHARAQSDRYTQLLKNSTSGIALSLKNRIFKAIYDRSVRMKLGAYDQTIAKSATSEAVRQLLGLNTPLKIPKEKVIESVFDTWMFRSSDLMKAMANSTGAAYLNIVVPSPYHSKKIFTESEKAFLKAPALETFGQANSAGYTLIEKSSRNVDIARHRFGHDTRSSDVRLMPPSRMVRVTWFKLGETMLTEFVARNRQVQI